MSFTDPIADMATRLRNAIAVEKTTVRLPHSKAKEAIAKVLAEEGYLTSVTTEERELVLEISTTTPTVITGIKRISTPGRRLYAGRYGLPRVRQGLGIAVISTSQGVMTADTARRRHLGGEVLLEVF